MAVLLVAMLATPFVMPGVLEPVEDGEDIRPSVIGLQEEDAAIRVLSVPGGTANLQIDTRLSHRGGPAENVTLEVRAIDSESGLLADRVDTSIGTISGDRSVSVLTNLSVEREGGYRIETIVYENGERVARGTKSISGVQALTPDYAQSAVEFEHFENSAVDIPAIAVDPTETVNNRTRLSVSAALTNTGDTAAGDVTLRLRARQVESNVIAADARQRVGSIRPGRTVWQNATMTVPSEYNYYVDAFLLKDGVVVDTALGVANLDPTRVVEANETREAVEFDTGDFTGPETDIEQEYERTEAETTVSGSGPGFGVGLPVVALLAIALLSARRQTDD